MRIPNMRAPCPQRRNGDGLNLRPLTGHITTTRSAAGSSTDAGIERTRTGASALTDCTDERNQKSSGNGGSKEGRSKFWMRSGIGKRRIIRRYVTDRCRIGDGFALLIANGRRWRILAEVTPTVKPATRWMAYGEGHPGSVITFRQTEMLPFEGKTVLERL